MRKRILILFLSLCVVASGIVVMPSGCKEVKAEELEVKSYGEKEGDTWDETQQYWYAELEDGTIEITGYTGSDTEITIPSTLDGKTVTRIGNDAFQSETSNTSEVIRIAIPSGVKSIGHYAFRDCSSLTDITIPNTVTTIEDEAFDGCEALPTITIPASVTSIGTQVFRFCEILTAITVDEDNTKYATIEGNLYNKQKNILLAYAPGKADTSFTIPTGVTMIGDYAFYKCDNLTKVTIAESVTTLGKYAFSSCNGLTSITIPGNVKIIGEDAFHWCSELADIVLEEGITTIGDEAFSACYKLTEITIPASVTNLENNAFYFCTGLTGIHVSPNNTRYASDAGILYNKNKTTLILCPHGKTGEITVPQTVTSIEYDAFNGCEDNITINCVEDSAIHIYALENDIACNVTLLPRYNVTFNANGGTNLSATSVTVKANGTISSLPTVSRSGYTFLGWYTASTGGSKITTSTKITKNQTLYAQWKKNQETCKVSFNRNGGSKVSKSSVTIEKNNNIGKLPTAERKGYAFKGQYTKKSGGTKITTTYKVTKNQTLYAQWTKISKPKKVATPKLKSSKSKQFNVKYTKVSGAKGYEISYTTNKKFKSVKKVTTSKTNITIKNLKKKTTYYVKVRAYKVDSAGKKVYGDYSKVVKLKIK